MKRPLLAALILFQGVSAHANRASIRIEIYPGISVADARSTVTVTAEVRDSSGKPVPNGTQVLFSTLLGSFRENVVRTENGYARAVLKAGGIPGTAKITASVPAFNAAATAELELLSDRSLLSSAKEYVEVVAPGYLMFSMDQAILGAAAPGQGVKLRYREIEIDADDLQLEVSTYTVRARKAKVRFAGKEPLHFQDLNLRLNNRKGVGTAVMDAPALKNVRFAGWMPVLETETRPRLGLVAVTSGGMAPQQDPLAEGTFEFADLSDSATQIAAKKAIVFPRKLVQFQRAEVYLGTSKVLNLPLYQVPLNGGPQVFAEQIVNVNDNQVSVNYPHYLSLKPGETSLVRFRLGNTGGRSFTATGGAYFDYELKWNRGDEFDGGLTYSGIGRKDWNLGLRQYVRFNDGLSAFAQVDTPSGKYLYTNANVTQVFNGFSANLGASLNRTLRGLRYEDLRTNFNVETDGSKFGRLPVTLYYGFNYTDSRTRAQLTKDLTTRRNFSDYALTTRAQLTPLNLDRGTNLNASFSVNARPQRKDQKVGMLGSLTLSRQLSGSASLSMTYDYVDDLASGDFFGKHRLGFQGFYGAGRTTVSLFGGRSLDEDRVSFYGDVSYELGGLWRVMGNYTFDKYLGDSVLDYGLGVAYRIGWREIGLTYSRQTKRLGLQILGTSLY